MNYLSTVSLFVRKAGAVALAVAMLAMPFATLVTPQVASADVGTSAGTVTATYDPDAQELFVSGSFSGAPITGEKNPGFAVFINGNTPTTTALETRVNLITPKTASGTFQKTYSSITEEPTSVCVVIYDVNNPSGVGGDGNHSDLAAGNDHNEDNSWDKNTPKKTFPSGACAGGISPPVAGEKTIVIDEIGDDSGNPPYTPPFSFSCEVNPLVSPVTVSGSGTGSTPPGLISQYDVQLDWGDGTKDNSVGTVTPNTIGSDHGGFTFTYTGTHDYLADGSYTIKALLYHNTTPGNDGDADALVSVQTCIVTEPPTTGDLTVIKHVVNTGGGTGVASNFSLSVKSGDVDVSGSPAAGSETGTTYSGLVPGAYTVSETGMGAHYTADLSACGGGNITVVAGQTTTCTITNTFHNAAPVAQDGSLTTAEDTAAGTTVVATDTDLDALLYAIVNNPLHGLLSAFNPSSGTVTYTPFSNYHGPDSFTFRANDGVANSNDGTITITVTPVNDAPVAQDDGYSTNEDTPLVVGGNGVLGNDSDVDGDSLTAVLVGGPAHGTLTLNPDGSFTYTPDADYNGNDSFTYKANDSTADSNTVTVDINVSSDNDAPVAQGDSYSTNEDSALTVPAPGVLTNDSDADTDPLTAVLDTNPTNGTVSLNPDGSFTYTPDADYNGTDSFTYHTNDGTADSSSVTVTITVIATNDAPIAEDQSIVTDQNAATSTALVASDIDADGLTFATTSSPTHGVLSAFDPVTGLFTYMPDLNYHGGDSFTYKANDGTADSNVATVSITVNELFENTLQLCSDEGDNDNDSLVDLEDPDCSPFIPSVTVVKHTVGNEGSFGFQIFGGNEFSTTATITTVDDAGTSSPISLDPGTYNVVENTLPSNWALSDVSCVYDNTAVGQAYEGGKTVTLDIGDHAVCTFTNTFTPDEPSADISISKTLGEGESTPHVGQNITYTLSVHNAGPDNAANVVVTDVLPSGLTWISDNSSGAYIPGTGVWTIGDLAEGISRVLSIIASVQSETEGDTIVNTASVTSNSEVTNDPDTDNNSDTVSLTVDTQCNDGIDNDEDDFTDQADPGCHTDGNAQNSESYNANDNSEANQTGPSSDISVTKSVDDATPDAGQSLVYTLTATNNGPDNATGVMVTDVLPSGLSYVSDDGAGAYVSTTGVWIIGTLLSGSSTVLHITTTVTGSAGQTITNTASVSGNNNTDSNSGNNSGSSPVTVNTPPTTPPSNPPSGGGGGGPISGPLAVGFGGGGGGGVVLGTSTEFVADCTKYLTAYIRTGQKNDTAQVIRLQNFLNNFEANKLNVNGTYDGSTLNAVNAFQSKYKGDVLTPWGAKGPTGYVYYTTQKKVNEIYCKFTKQFPLSADQITEIARIKALGEAYTPPATITKKVTAPKSEPETPTQEVPKTTTSTDNSSQTAGAANSSNGSWFGKLWNWLRGN